MCLWAARRYGGYIVALFHIVVRDKGYLILFVMSFCKLTFRGALKETLELEIKGCNDYELLVTKRDFHEIIARTQGVFLVSKLKLDSSY